MQTHINPQFHTTTSNNENSSPWEKPKIKKFDDLILKPEFQTRKLRFHLGETWFRILPAMEPSAYGWMMAVHSLSFDGGRIAHPRTLRPNAKSVFDHAFAWAKKHHPNSLYSRENRRGVRLLSDPFGLCWCIVTENGKSVARLIMASGYDSSRGGDPGISHRIWSAAHRLDENGNPLHDIINPQEGRLVCVQKSWPEGGTRPIFHVSVGRHPAPIAEMMASLNDVEINALTPLENTIRQLDQDEEWQALAKLIAPSTVAVIRASIKH